MILLERQSIFQWHLQHASTFTASIITGCLIVSPFCNLSNREMNCFETTILIQTTFLEQYFNSNHNNPSTISKYYLHLPPLCKFFIFIFLQLRRMLSYHSMYTPQHHLNHFPWYIYLYLGSTCTQEITLSFQIRLIYLYFLLP
jgi:hypothetical protein